MKIRYIIGGAVKEPWCVGCVQFYLDKIDKFAALEVVRIKGFKSPRSRQFAKKQQESEQILSKISTKDYVILCDESGKNQNTKEFCQLLSGLFDSGKSSLVFVVGGVYGVNDKLKKRANFIWSLSHLTLNHMVAHVVALEQIYRVLMMRKGVPYHNE